VVGSYNQGRVFGLGSEAVRAREQLQQAFMPFSESSMSLDVEQLLQERVEVIRDQLQKDFDQRVA
jgi:hypothetical protein